MPIPKKNTLEPPKSAKLRVFEILRDWIIDGTLQPGEKILDSEISDYFNISRTPVREAMQMLSDRKLIEVFPGKGSVVTSPGAVNVRQIYRILAEIHCLALEFAWLYIEPSDISELKRLNRRLQESAQKHDHKDCCLCDYHFHNVFVRLAGNPFISDITDVLSSHVARLENIYFGSMPDVTESVRIHEAIIEALENNDPETAHEQMHLNWMHTVDALMKADPDLLS
ncbi:MAG: GntR family transcriptional regulator [Lachnospiraceae bacterium]|nr:GntR family transcriptional regulator [Lachnospiraceae bacterium]